MSKTKKYLIATILIVIFALCFIPSQNYNSKYKLNIVSAYGDDQAYHPKVITFTKPWNGYKYWMSYTPYPKGDDSKENPSIAVSNDLITWSTPKGLINPIDEPEETKPQEKYNSDSHIVYNQNLDRIECYWRYVDDTQNKVIIYRKYTTDGVHWSEKEITANSNDRKTKDYISPAILIDNNIYKMWYVDQGNIITYAISEDGIYWKDVKTIEMKYDKDLKTWHLDVIKTEKGYEMINVAYDEWKNRNDMSLYYSYSKEGINWSKSIEILKPSKNSTYWDNKGIYRSCFIYENGKYFVFYGGTSKNYEHGVGLVYGEDIYNLNKVSTNFKDYNQIEKLKKEILKVNK